MLASNIGNGCTTPLTTIELKYPNPGLVVELGDGEYPLGLPNGDCGATGPVSPSQNPSPNPSTKGKSSAPPRATPDNQPTDIPTTLYTKTITKYVTQNVAPPEPTYR